MTGQIMQGTVKYHEIKRLNGVLHRYVILPQLQTSF